MSPTMAVKRGFFFCWKKCLSCKSASVIVVLICLALVITSNSKTLLGYACNVINVTPVASVVGAFRECSKSQTLSRAHSSDVGSVQQSQSIDGTVYTSSSQGMSSLNTNIAAEGTVCPAYTLGHVSPTTRPKEQAACRAIMPGKMACQLARELFASQGAASCDHQQHHSLCSITMQTARSYAVTCRPPPACSPPFMYGRVDWSTGLLRWENMTRLSALENTIAQLIDTPSQNGFCFVGCQGQSGTLHQLLTLPPSVLQHASDNLNQQVQQPAIDSRKMKRRVREKRKSGHLGTLEKFSLNILLLDSVSRNHFYRSLPRTSESLRKISLDSSSRATVLDFELVQGLKPRTHEFLTALFTGESSEGTSTNDSSGHVLKIESLFGPLSAESYRTLWMEDMCWRYQWGISKDLGLASDERTKWSALQRALHRGKVDDLGLTLSNCEIFRSLNITDPFHGPRAVCYNGKYQHDYQLEYLQLYQETLLRSNIPFATFFASDVGHEDSGRRIQTIDSALSSYIHSLQHQASTVTLLLSDHGNSYGLYPEQSLEGRMEMFHPFVFLIVPERLASHLGQAAMQTLLVNQKRLISVVDVHHTLMALLSGGRSSGGAGPSGVLSPVPANRTCDDLPLQQPSLCICENYDRVVSNDSEHAILAEFALGQLNDLLQKQHSSSTHGGRYSSLKFAACQRLAAYMFTDVREKYQSDGSVITRLDLHVLEVRSQTAEIFLVSLQHYAQPRAGGSVEMVLLSFDRMTPYRAYEACADPGVDLRLCLCDTSAGRSFGVLSSPQHPPTPPGPRRSDATRIPESAQRHTANATRCITPPCGNHGNTSLHNDPADWLRRPRKVFQATTKVHCVDKQEDQRCLYILYRKYNIGAAFEIMNQCSDKIYQISFQLRGVNVSFSSPMPRTLTVKPLHIQFVTTVCQLVIHRDWYWKYQVEYSVQESQGKT